MGDEIPPEPGQRSVLTAGLASDHGALAGEGAKKVQVPLRNDAVRPDYSVNTPCKARLEMQAELPGCIRNFSPQQQQRHPQRRVTRSRPRLQHSVREIMSSGEFCGMRQH